MKTHKGNSSNKHLILENNKNLTRRRTIKPKKPEIPQEILVPRFDTIFRHNLVNHK
jgi:hypothetical protein